MRIALIGSDDETLAIARAVDRHPGHALVGVYQPRDHAAELRALLQEDGAWDEGWEALLHDAQGDAVVIAGSDRGEDRDQQLRKLVQAGIPLLVIHPACEAIVAFELDMIRHDTRSVLLPYRPWRWHPALLQLVDSVPWEGAAAQGRVEQVTLDREMQERDPQRVLAQLARDAGILHPLLGRIDRVGAMGGDRRQLTNLTVTLSGQDGRIARWTVHPATGGPRARLTVVGTAGSRALEMPHEPQRWRAIDAPDNVEGWDDWDPATAALTALSRAIEEGDDGTSWLQATRELEIVDGVERSLQRGRTIELLDQRPQEEGTFKGIMAVGGCGLLLLTLAILIVGSVVEGLQLPRRRPSPEALADPNAAVVDAGSTVEGRHLLIRLWPVYPFGIFLLLQLFRLVYPAERRLPKERAAEPAHPPDERP